uniref:Reverse transcriptase zinc-binding domain-containing protein n=1 Tax=Ananas comosus var. bracteatus TaxID=296719 RepID=A0A6V7P1J0_ANACO|nr:unnamed protein product [Ananas comosus var. bracteatus]
MSSSGELTVQKQFPNLYALSTHKQLSIKNWIRRLAHNTGLDLHPILCLGEQQQRELGPFNALVHNTALTDCDDKAIWRWCEDGKFSVRKAYDFLIFDGIDVCTTPYLWKLKIPLRVKVFLWLAGRSKILTADNLSKRAGKALNLCSLPTRWNRARQSLKGLLKRNFDICLAATCWELWN